MYCFPFYNINFFFKICDADCNILNVDASYGGATHDSFIWANSEIKSHMENLNEDCTFLLGMYV